MSSDLLVNKDSLVPLLSDIPFLQSSIGLWKLSSKSHHYPCIHLLLQASIMHASILFTVASLFLIGSHSLPQPMNLDATSSIKERQAHYQP